MLLPIQWRPKYIEGYEGEYGAVRAGFVFSFKRWKFLKGSTDKDGYKTITLKGKYFVVHRLVAQTFLDNPNNLPEVNHKDENKANNTVWNLEWCDRIYNNNYGTRNKKISTANKGKKNPNYGKHHTEETIIKMSNSKKGENNPMYGKKGKDNPNYGKGKPVLMFTKDGQFIRKFDSIADANEYLGKPRKNGNIRGCVEGKNGQQTAWGYRWTYDMQD